MTNERPIIFSGEMVKAILAGRKTQTRRVCSADLQDLFSNCRAILDRRPDQRGCPYGEVGDQIWVREGWRTLHKDDCLKQSHLANDIRRVTYEADPENRNPLWAFGKRRRSIHMPRWASRITLEITDVRVQRLQEISVDDCYAEGLDSHGDGHFRARGLAVNEWPRGDGGCDGYAQDGWDNARMVYADLWDSANAKRGHGWDSNPFVWVISFRRVAV